MKSRFLITVRLHFEVNIMKRVSFFFFFFTDRIHEKCKHGGLYTKC